MVKGKDRGTGLGAHFDTAPAWNGVATFSSPFQSLSQGDEDIAAPKAHPQWAGSTCAWGWGSRLHGDWKQGRTPSQANDPSLTLRENHPDLPAGEKKMISRWDAEAGTLTAPSSVGAQNT